MEGVLKRVLGEDYRAIVSRYGKCPEKILSFIVKHHGEAARRVVGKLGRGYSRRYICRIGDRTVEIYTYLGDHTEYIIFTRIGVCGCRSLYKLDRLKGLLCHHLIGFALDYIFDSIVTYDYPASDAELIVKDFTSFIEEIKSL